MLVIAWYHINVTVTSYTVVVNPVNTEHLYINAYMLLLIGHMPYPDILFEILIHICPYYHIYNILPFVYPIGLLTL